MRMYFRNVLRGILNNKAPYLGAVCIIALGMMVYVAMADYLINIRRSMQVYYDSNDFADVFATVEGMPEDQLKQLEDLDGIETAFGRQTANARYLREDTQDIIVMHLMAFTPEDSLNRMESGGVIPAFGVDDILVGSGMSDAYKLKEGDPVQLVLNGKASNFTYRRYVTEPEYLSVFADSAASISDPLLYDIAAVNKGKLEEMTGRKGIVNELGFRLKSGYTYEDVRYELQDALQPYGLSDIVSRAKQISNNEIQTGQDQYAAAGTAFPAVFMLCSMFMLYIVLKKLVDKDRALIGTMKAMGGYDRELLLIYMMQAVALGLAGGLLGILASRPFAVYLYEGDTEAYRFKSLPFESSLPLKAFALLCSVGACVVSVYMAVKDVVAINPAESMRTPEPKVTGKFSLPPLLRRILNLRQVIGLRSIFRNPMRSAVTILAVAVSFGMIANFTSFQKIIIDKYVGVYDTVETYDVSVSLKGLKLRDDAAAAVSRLSYVRAAEPTAEVSVILRSRNHEKYSGLSAIRSGSDMKHPTDQYGKVHTVKGSGLVMNKIIADKLELKAGDTVSVEASELSPYPVNMLVSDIIDDNNGTGCYMDIDFLPAVFGCPGVANQLLIKMDASHIDELKADMKKSPDVDFIVENFKLKKENADSYSFVTMMMNLFSFFSIIMGVIMISNITDISIRERRNEFGTLMILGTTQAEVNEIIIFEHSMDFLLGILFGFPVSFVLERVVEKVISYDTFVMVMQISPGIYFMTFLICLCIITLSTALVIRNVRGIVLTDILKERG